jgi:zinc protease
MMFNGARSSARASSTGMEAALGNAYTSNDVTPGLVPAQMEQIFGLEANRIRDLAFDPKMIESERGVGPRSPPSVDGQCGLSEQLWATAYGASVRWPVVG